MKEKQILTITRNGRLDQLAMIRQHFRNQTARLIRNIGRCALATIERIDRDIEHDRAVKEARLLSTAHKK